MDNQAFLAAYNESRNGCNGFVSQPIRITPGNVPFHYSDGVEQLAKAGCFWLIDIVATECPKPLRKSGSPTSIVKVTVATHGVGNRALLELTIADDLPPIWKRLVEYTDMPIGEYVFELVDERERFAFTLVSEH